MLLCVLKIKKKIIIAWNRNLHFTDDNMFISDKKPNKKIEKNAEIKKIDISKNVKKDSINIGKYISKKYKNILVKEADKAYKIFWEGKYQPVVIVYYFNLSNKNKN